MSEEKEFKLKDIDEGLNQEIINQYKIGFEAYIRGDYRTTFKCYKYIFMSVSCYEYKNKDKVNELNNILEDYFNTLGSKANNQHEELIIGQKAFELKALIDIYITTLVETLNSIGKWLKVYFIDDNIDNMISKDFFNTSVDLLDDKKKELEFLESKELLKLLNPKHINEIHARYLITTGAK